MTGQCLYCKCRHFLRSDTDERSRISQLFSAETVVSAAAKQSCTVSMFLHRGLWVLSTLNFTECALKIDTQTQKNCCSENLTLNLQTIFQKCESTNPSHSHSRLWSINLYGHRDGTQKGSQSNTKIVLLWGDSVHRGTTVMPLHTYHLTILQKIDCHLYSTLESDLLHIVSVWYRPCHAYFKIASPSRQLTKCPLWVSIALREIIHSCVFISGLQISGFK